MGGGVGFSSPCSAGSGVSLSKEEGRSNMGGGVSQN